MAAHEIRLSQMVLVWGPGAVVETPRGPRILLRPDLGLFTGGTIPGPEEFELTRPHLRSLLGGRRVFQIPSNALLRKPSGEPVYQTRPFPEWKLCVHHGYLYRNRCPECKTQGYAEAVRFVRACGDGHLDDVDWDHVVHDGDPPHSPGHYLWKGVGGSLSELIIICPVKGCGRQTNMGRVWGATWPCSGRFPEREGPGSPPVRPGCGRGARIIQRQASNLRIPEIRTFFTVELYTRLHRLLSLPVVQDVLNVANQFDPLFDTEGNLRYEVLRKAISPIGNRPGFGEAEKQEILRCSPAEIAGALRDIMHHRPAGDMAEMLEREFRVFRQGAREGIPPQHAAHHPHSRILLEINPHDCRQVAGFGRQFLIVPIRHLHSITVQTGYRRVVESPAAPAPIRTVDIAFQRNGDEWLPGFESYGEGIFITLADDTQEGGLEGEAARKWLEAGNHPYPADLFRSPCHDEIHPGFVWWHTLSHLLIRALAVESGYAAASLRERVYLQHGTGRTEGGILIHTVARGADGSFGGLLALVPVFERILEHAMDMLETCSADPLCIDRQFSPGDHLGAACHACLLIAETSCEHRNLWLDRHVLLESIP